MEHYRIIALVFLYVLSNTWLSSEGALSPQALEASKKMMRNMCVNKSGVKSDVLSATKNGEFADDRKLKCYMSCCLGFMKILKKNAITYDVAVKQVETQLPPDLRPKMLEILNGCKDVGGTDPCEIAYNFVTCGHKISPTSHIVPY